MRFINGYAHMGKRSWLWTYGQTGCKGERDGAVVQALKQTDTHETQGLYGKGPKGKVCFIALTVAEVVALANATNYFYG